MAVYVDISCTACDATLNDQWSDMIGLPHVGCPSSGAWERVWTLCPSVAPNTHPSERVVVYESEREGKIQYPGQNNVPVPDRLQSRGYVRRELNVRDLHAFEKKHNVMNERRHYDRNGRYE